MKFDINYTDLLVFENLLSYSELFQFSTTIKGGVSTNNYSSFNLGLYSGDITENVIENRKRLCNILNIPLDNLYLPYQTHEDKVCIIDQQFLNKNKQEKDRLLNGVDAVITNIKHICIGVTTADCVPVLIYDPVNNVIAAVHAGWRGTVSKILQRTMIRMQNEFGCDPTDMIAGVAPSISQQNFEIGDEVAAEFETTHFPMEEISFRDSITQKAHIHLQDANKYLLIQAGVLPQNIEIANMCTYENDSLFFSARRQTINSGRMVTGAMLR